MPDLEPTVGDLTDDVVYRAASLALRDLRDHPPDNPQYADYRNTAIEWTELALARLKGSELNENLSSGQSSPTELKLQELADEAERGYDPAKVTPTGRDWVNECCEHGCDCGECWNRSPDEETPHHCLTRRGEK